jgi:hypothetical protein
MVDDDVYSITDKEYKVLYIKFSKMAEKWESDL